VYKTLEGSTLHVPNPRSCTRAVCERIPSTHIRSLLGVSTRVKLQTRIRTEVGTCDVRPRHDRSVLGPVEYMQDRIVVASVPALGEILWRFGGTLQLQAPESTDCKYRGQDSHDDWVQSANTAHARIVT